MRQILAVFFVFVLSVTCLAQGLALGRFKNPTGFTTISYSAERWAALDDRYKLKGKVGDVLTYQDIRSMTILRLFMSIPDASYLEQTIISSISPEQQFVVKPLDNQHQIGADSTLLIVLFETTNGDLGLITRYGNVTIIEYKSQIGMIWNK